VTRTVLKDIASLNNTTRCQHVNAIEKCSKWTVLTCFQLCRYIVMRIIM